MKRQLTFWRVVAVLAIAAAGVAAIARLTGVGGEAFIARVTVNGVIAEDFERDALLAALAEDPNVRAVILHVNSPGGTVVGGEDLFNGVRRIARAKPVVAVMGTLATSAAYLGALGADRIFAREGTLTGSIGVLVQTADVSRLLENLGVTTEAITSGPLKAQPSPLTPLSEPGRAAIESIVDDMYGFFVDTVVARRALERAEVERLADGRVFTGGQARTLRLVDAIGGEAAAVAWLEEARDVSKDLPIKTVNQRGEIEILTEWLTSLAGKGLVSKALTLDGLVSLWQPTPY